MASTASMPKNVARVSSAIKTPTQGIVWLVLLTKCPSRSETKFNNSTPPAMGRMMRPVALKSYFKSFVSICMPP